MDSFDRRREPVLVRVRGGKFISSRHQRVIPHPSARWFVLFLQEGPVRQYTVVVSALFLLASGSVSAAGKGQGGCSIKDGAPIYAKSKSDKVIGKVNLHACVVGITTRGILGNEYIFEQEDGRVHVAAFKNREEKGMYATAWMDPADLSNFTFECGCGSSDNQKAECTPFSGIVSFTWNPCFLEARQKKLDDLKASAAAPVSAAAASSRTTGNEKALRNDDVLSLIKVGLDDALTIAKIQQSKAVAFDVSTEGIVALKKAGASNAVIDAMMKRAASQ
jgi:hypothetical protein